MSEVRLLVRADDAGSCRSANDAIIEACDAGAVKNVSVMVCGPEFAHAAGLLRDRPDICLGLHIVLNAEWTGPRWGPVLPPEQVPSLVESETGYFTHFPHDLHQRGFSVVEAFAEVQAQWQKATDAGLKFSYLDEHMGVGWLPGLRETFADFAREHGLIDAMELPLSPLRISATGGEGTAEQLANCWQEAINSSGTGTYLLVTHPGKDAPDMQAFAIPGEFPGKVAYERERERAALVQFGQKALPPNCHLIRYDEF